jgi:hypothetical protein
VREKVESTTPEMVSANCVCYFKSEIPYARKIRHKKEINMRYFLTSFEGSNK